MSVKPPQMKHSFTPRGFARVDFADLYGEACSLQQSSLATKRAIWLGCERETIHHVTKQPCGARMHLDRKLVRQLVIRLNRWLEKGTFK